MDMEELIRGAEISLCGKYRYRLTRLWDRSRPRLGVIMLNPSTADADKDDPTIRKVMEFAKRLGYGGIEVVNLFALRATKQKDLWAAVEKDGYSAAVGASNDISFKEMLSCTAAVMCAWGVEDKKDNIRSRVNWLHLHVFNENIKLFDIGKTQGGSPRHPLYVPYSAVDAVPDAYKVA